MRTSFFPSSHLMFLSLFLSLTSALATVRLVEAQPSAADTVRFLEQSTFGPTPELIARVRQAGFDAFLDEQLAAPISDYPELPFWPQTRPTSCTGDCQRDNYTYYQLQRHFFTNALYGQDQLRQRVAFALGQILGYLPGRRSPSQLDARLSATALSKRLWQLSPTALRRDSESDDGSLPRHVKQPLPDPNATGCQYLSKRSELATQ